MRGATTTNMELEIIEVDIMRKEEGVMVAEVMAAAEEGRALVQQIIGIKTIEPTTTQEEAMTEIQGENGAGGHQESIAEEMVYHENTNMRYSNGRGWGRG